MSNVFRSCRLLGSSFGNVWGFNQKISRQFSSLAREEIEQAVEKVCRKAVFSMMDLLLFISMVSAFGMCGARNRRCGESCLQVNELFVEARDEIEFTKEDIGTTYFNDAFQDAKKLVDETISEYRKLLDSLNGDEKGKLQRSMGMKMEQLKAELDHLHEH